MVSNKKSEELPYGWMAQVNVANGKTVYIEKSTGRKLYSRRQVLRHLDKVHRDSSSVKENENDDVNGHSTGELTKSKQSESVEDKCHISGEENTPGNPSLKEKENINELDWNISGEENTPGSPYLKEKENINELDCHISGEENTPRNPSLKEEENINELDRHISGEENTPGNPSLKEKENINELDWLPHGWIKELRTRKYRKGFKQDPYYTDTVSGYVFRSKKDVLRYLETGDLRSCKTKPQKRDLTELKLKGVLNSPSPDNVKKEEYSASVGQLSAADLPEKEGDISKEKEADCLPFESAFRASTTDAKEKLQYAEAAECYKSEENSMSRSEGSKHDLKLVDGKGVSTPTMTAHSRKSKRKLPSVPRRSSKRLASHGPAVKEEVNGSSCLFSEVAVCEKALQLDTDSKEAPEYRNSSFTEDSPDSKVQVTAGARDTDSLFNKEVASKVHQQLNTDIYNEASRDINVHASVIPGNINSVSNYTAGSEVPQQLNTDIYNEASRDKNVHASVIPGNINCVSNNAAGSEVPQQLDSNLYFEASLDTDLHATINSGDEQTGVINAAVSEVPQQNLDELVTSGTSALSQSRIDMDLNCTLESCFQDMDVQHQTLVQGYEHQTLVQGYETQKVMDPRFQADYWSDPCFDFAFKTLAGGMPFEETLELDSCFQPQAEPSYTQDGGVSFVVPDMNAPVFFQNDETYKLDPVSADISMDHQLQPANPTSLPVKASLPGCSNPDSQPEFGG